MMEDTAAMFDNILLFNSLGFATFPVFSSDGISPFPHKAKEPAVKTWKGRAPDIFTVYAEEEAYAKTGAFGIILRPGDLVVDLDPRNFVDGVNPWKKLRADHGLGNLSAPAVLTGGGGVHIYFSKPPDINILAKLKNYPGLDFKAGGHNKGVYVLGPGSKHPSGKTYEFSKNANFTNIPIFPPSLLEFIIAKKKETEKGTGVLTGGKQEETRYISHILYKEIPDMAARGGDAQRFRVACVGRDYGLPPEKTLAVLIQHYNPVCTPVWPKEKLEECVDHAYKYASGTIGKHDPALVFDTPVPAAAEEWDNEAEGSRKWDMDGNGNVKKTMRNAVNFLYITPGLAGKVRFNQFTADLEAVGKLPWSDMRGTSPVWTDRDVVLLKYHLHKTCRVEFPVETLWEALYTAGTRFAYHPIREYIKKIEWDKTPRLETWLKEYCATADNEYIRAVAKKILVAAVARVFNPGTKFDHCLVLEGDQGIGKSTVCAIFGGEWYGDIVLNPHSRDTIDAMRGKWIIEMSEMEVLKRADVQALRAFISRISDRTRLAYARASQDFPRQCVFIGTINPDGLGYLNDTAGNRRFWPVRCGRTIDMTGLRLIRDQLFAEAYTAFKRGEELFLTGDVAKLAEQEQSERMYADPWMDAIASWMDGPGVEVKEVTVPQIWELALGGAIKAITRSDQTRIGIILTRFGWFKYRPLRGGSRTKVYQKPAEEKK